MFICIKSLEFFECKVVDDTTLVGDTRESLQWLYEVGQLRTHLLSAGIKVDPHSCWRAAFVNSTACSCSVMPPLHPLEWILHSEGYSTLTDAILPLRIHRHYHGFVAICRDRFFVCFPSNSYVNSQMFLFLKSWI